MCHTIIPLPPRLITLYMLDHQYSGDGPKWMCGVDILKSDALIYSFGSNGITSFEQAINKISHSDNIFIFDPTLTPAKRAAVKEVKFPLIEIGLVGKTNQNEFDGKVSKLYPTRTLPDHMRHLGHANKKINVLKVDIEGSEYSAFSDIVIGECATADILVDQLLIEVHGVDRNLVISLMKMLHKCNMRLFSKERNGWGCHGWYCLEYSFVSPSFAFEVFQSTHPSCLAK